MATLLTGNITTTTSIADGEDVFLSPTATVNAAAILFDFADLATGTLSIAGMAITSNGDGVRMNGDDTLTVTSTGSLYAMGGDADAIDVTGSNNTLIISGYVYGADNGVIDFSSDGNETIITSTGTIRGGANNGGLSGDAAAFATRGLTHTLRNDGTLIAELNPGTGRYIAVANADAGDGDANFNDSFDAALTFINTGLVIGDVLMQAGDDVFDGRGGTVEGGVYGGLGNDLYIVDDSSASLFEAPGGGVDTVQSTASFALGGFFENLTLLGSDAIDGAGNSSRNIMTGNAGANALYGNNSRDTIDGGAGADTLDGGRGDDYMLGGEGNDVMFGRAGVDIMDGGDEDDFMFGGIGNDVMSGGDGNDTLKGGAGSDTMDGGAGQDVFLFCKASDSPGGGSDLINNFEVGQDTLDFSALASGVMDVNILGGLSGGGQASLRTFENSYGDTIVFVDADGDGGSDMRIEVNLVTGLTEADFFA